MAVAYSPGADTARPGQSACSPETARKDDLLASLRSWSSVGHSPPGFESKAPPTATRSRAYATMSASVTEVHWRIIANPNLPCIAVTVHAGASTELFIV